MASGGSNLSTRMSAEDYRRMCEIAFQHFKEHKVEISDAIKTVFPFLEILRDRGFITNEKYKEFKKHYKNLSLVPRVVYDVLNELEEKFDMSLLETLFSKSTMKNYPDLNEICKDFRDVIQKTICQVSHEGESAKKPNAQLRLGQGVGECLRKYPAWLYPDTLNYKGTAIPENELSEYLCEKEQINKKETGITSGNNELESQQANEQCAQESYRAESMNLRKSPTSGNRLHKRMRIPEGPSGLSAEEQRPGAGSPAVGSGAGVEGPADLGENSTAQKTKRKRWSKPQEEEYVDFCSETLPVTCGEMKGMLYKNKLEEGSTVKCIKTEDGNWFTPREFGVAGGYQKSTNWKRIVRCGGNTLKWLMKEGKLHIPPGKYGKEEKLETSDVCEVCWYGEDLIRCDTCSRVFHGSCHLPPVDTKRRPWSCTLCRIKEPAGRQPVYHESEVLKRPMGPEEQLKCEFLLLEIYCHPDSCCLEIIQQDNCPLETSKGMDKSMMLNKIKKNLSERCYPCVEGFVRDMRLIFQNHRAFYKGKDLFLLGIGLEEKFEQNFKEVFAIQELKQDPTDNKIKRQTRHKQK
ncbi:nuclear body protein SP140-like [Pteronotus mesoamericanus]|uniref:nuclear body protein SP140-like n=1 Tax=Pteronotus mesoamericanus TaxID=1884717 RepID=UPI0023EA8DB9|nr:nuclear body protein SP140-like [Pteronotus parnellii mesoamericanus]